MSLRQRRTRRSSRRSLRQTQRRTSRRKANECCHKGTQSTQRENLSCLRFCASLWLKRRVMGNLSILSRSEIEGLGPPMLEELADSGIHEQFLCDLTLKHVAMLPEPSTTTVAER